MLRMSIAGLMMASALAGGAAGEPIQAGRQHHWARVPNGDDMARTYPRAAEDHGVSRGKATLRCKLTDNGYLTACSVVSESPEGFGFGAAALRLADRFRLKDEAEGSEIDIPITWFTY